jgi:predicted amidohydrolase
MLGCIQVMVDGLEVSINLKNINFKSQRLEFGNPQSHKPIQGWEPVQASVVYDCVCPIHGRNEMRIGYYQYCPEFGAPAQNLERVQDTLAGINADIIVLPELAFTGYFFEDRKELKDLAEDVSDSQTVIGLSKFCRDNDFHLVVGFAERQKDKLYNSALVIGPLGLIHTYRKLHLFNTEKEYFDPGDTPLGIVKIRGAKVGVMICFDWAFPEVARVLALQGSDLICHPSNLVLTHCQKAMLTRSLENSVYSVTANRTGKEIRPRGELSFTGNSQIVGPKGNIMAQSNSHEDKVVVQEIDLAIARDKSITENNDLFGDRRPEFYNFL